jgi:hypothetical protein
MSACTTWRVFLASDEIRDARDVRIHVVEQDVAVVFGRVHGAETTHDADHEPDGNPAGLMNAAE